MVPSGLTAVYASLNKIIKKKNTRDPIAIAPGVSLAIRVAVGVIFPHSRADWLTATGTGTCVGAAISRSYLYHGSTFSSIP